MGRLRLTYVLALLLIGFGIAGCSDETTDPPDDNAHVHHHAQVLFFNAANSQPTTTLVIDGVGIAAREYDVLKENYVEVEAGSYTTQLTGNGLTDILAEKTFTFTEDEHYTLFAINNESDVVDAVLFQDDLTAPAADKAHIRLAHFIADAPAVKMAFAGSGTGPIFEGISFADNTEFFTPVPAGTYSIRVQDNAGGGGGGGGGGGSQGLVPDLDTTLEAGKIYTVVMQGELADDSGKLVLITHE